MRLGSVALVMLFFAATVAAAESGKPSVLIDSWGTEVDLIYMRQLQAAGIEVDAIPHHQLTWERLQRYHVLVLVDAPEAGKVTIEPAGGPSSGPNLEETQALLDRYTAAGGGVMLNLMQHANSAVFHNSTQQVLQRYGARRPQETVTVPADQSVLHPHSRMPFFFTDQVSPSPVSEGVTGIWYPQGVSWVYAGGPIDVDNSWTVVLRAPANSRTQPIPTPESKPGIPALHQPLVRSAGVAQPPLFAIRDLKPGRLALFHAAPQFHFGSGLSWFHSGVMLDKGLQGKSSDFGKLFVNTLRWLAEPALASKQLGGAITPPERWARPLEKKDDPNYLRYFGPQDAVNLDPALPPPPVQTFTGIIGPRTAASGGTGSVADYAAVARAKGLSFILFLEDAAQFNAQKLAQLTADCKAASGKDLLLIAGYRAKTNIGNQMFFYGQDPLFLHDKYLSRDKKILMLQPQDDKGVYTDSKIIDFVFEALRNETNAVGFFDFTGPVSKGGMAVSDLRLASMTGVVYHDHGKRIEDVTDQYLLANAGTMSSIPVAINLLDSPAAMAAEIDKQSGLTYAVASSHERLWEDALGWCGTNNPMQAYPSSGPRIAHWPNGAYRTSAYAGELFATERMLITPQLHVTAEAGLKEISIFEGTRLFRRFLPNGAKDFSLRMFLSGSLQRNLTLVATDTKGGRATSFPLRGWNAGGPSSVFCSDHINEGTMKAFRGPGWSRFTAMPLVAEAGQHWDGMGNLLQQAAFSWGAVIPTFTTSAGIQADNLYQTSVMDACDDRVWRGLTLTRGIMLPGVPHLTPWSAFGPIGKAPLVDMTGAFTEWARYQTGTATGWGPTGIEGGPAMSMYTQRNTFLKDQTLTLAYLGHCWRQELPANLLLLTGKGDQVLSARDVNPKGSRAAPGTASYRIDTGAWFAVVSPNSVNALWFVNRGVPLRLEVSAEKSELTEDLPAGGIAVKAGEVRTIEWTTCWWPLDTPISDSDDLLRWVRYFAQPTGLELVRGTRAVGHLGVIDLVPHQGAVELKLPRAPAGMDPNLPVRIAGFNPRWSAILWQKEGYTGANRHGSAADRFRSLSLDVSGNAYLPIHSGQAALHHVVVGQPVIADAAGKALFIEVVCLKDAKDGNPPQWHVSVNNPTDASITTTLTQAIALPGLNLAAGLITIPAGGYALLVHAP